MKKHLLPKSKRFIALLLAVSIITAFSGCSQNSVAKTNIISDYSVEDADYSLDIDATDEIHDISDLLYGIFFEDINFSADGGLYAEKIVNRSFEFTDLAVNDEMYGWQIVGDATADVQVDDTENCLNENNTNYLVLSNNSGTQAGIENVGFLDGISVEKGESYDFSIYAKGLDGYTGGLSVKIATDKKTIATGEINEITNEWAKYSLTLTANATKNENVTLQVLLDDNSSVAIDMVSLFPQDTYKGRENGLRNDLATKLEELEPKFLRFPGGCVTEGYDDDSDYSWKDSIGVGSDGLPLEFNGTYGDVAARKQGINIWTDINATDDEWPSYMTYGLGFYEYFQLAEDIGAVGVPVINCGLYCQARGGKAVDVNSDRFKEYIQDMLDLVEFCRGDENTTWGKVRVSLGHEEPFELKYICIGNENYGDDYYTRYQLFLDAFNDAKAENPELYDSIELIYSSGTDDATSGSDYMPAYEYAKEQIGTESASSFAGAVDQHYYNAPEWFLKNTDYYDEKNYSRDTSSMTDTQSGGAINVFLGEYASQSNTVYSALSEAAYMTGLERNGDIVRMATYAPLFGNTTAQHWSPDLIWFNNSESIGSASYYIQKLFSTNAGTTLLSSTLDGANLLGNKVLTGKIGLGTWLTSAEFDNVKIVSNGTGETLAEDDFSSTQKEFDKQWEKITDGEFVVSNGKLCQQTTEMETSNTGSVVYFGDTSWSNYTFTVDATKLDGEEGFIIPFAVEDSDNNYFWNIGGWGNTVSCLQHIQGGTKSEQVLGTVKDIEIETGKTYSLKIVVDGSNIKCYIDDELYIDYDAYSEAEAEAYQVVSTDDSGDIIVKLVNVTDSSRTFAVNITDSQSLADTADAYQVSGDSLSDENVLGEDEKCVMNEFSLSGISNSFNYTIPKYSATVIRIHR
jgi:alpha-L-arabinofuranosidase